MNKKEILKKIKFGEEQKKELFVDFIQAEKFDIAIDKVGNFKKDMPIYYKQISENKFLVFNIPYYGKEKNASFQTDFWEITAVSQNEILNQNLLDENRKTILLGFDLTKDIAIYKSQGKENRRQ